jgi:hypothetical protein
MSESRGGNIGHPTPEVGPSAPLSESRPRRFRGFGSESPERLAVRVSFAVLLAKRCDIAFPCYSQLSSSAMCG